MQQMRFNFEYCLYCDTSAFVIKKIFILREHFFNCYPTSSANRPTARLGARKKKLAFVPLPRGVCYEFSNINKKQLAKSCIYVSICGCSFDAHLLHLGTHQAKFFKIQKLSKIPVQNRLQKISLVGTKAPLWVVSVLKTPIASIHPVCTVVFFKLALEEARDVFFFRRGNRIFWGSN